MSQNPQIQLFRLSFIWTETNTALLGNPVPANARMNFLGSRDSYVERFEQVRQGNKEFGLDLPWRGDPLGQRFWKFYLPCNDLRAVGGGKAWKLLTPFRADVPFTLNSRSLGTTFDVHGYLYPHGFAVVVNVNCKASLTLEHAVEVGLKIKGDEKISVQRAAGDVEDMYLKQIAFEGLTALRRAATSTDQSPGQISDDAFSVFTVIKGSGVDAQVPIKKGTRTHRILDAFSSLDQTWKIAALPKLEEAVIEQRQKAPASHVLYASKRGRAVWFPGSFTRQDVKRPSITCYHKNLVFASMQVESLCGLATVTAKEIRQGKGPTLRKWHSECAKAASDILGRMFGYDEEMYRSRSPRVQMEQNHYVDDVDEVRLFFNKKKLF